MKYVFTVTEYHDHIGVLEASTTYDFPLNTSRGAAVQMMHRMLNRRTHIIPNHAWRATGKTCHRSNPDKYYGVRLQE